MYISARALTSRRIIIKALTERGLWIIHIKNVSLMMLMDGQCYSYYTLGVFDSLLSVPKSGKSALLFVSNILGINRT